MNLTVKLFAGARELAGQEAVEVDLPAGATIGDLRRQMGEQFPSLAPLLPHAIFAVDAEYVSDDAPAPENAEIACIPPVSGG
jgi:molybdopterin synthase sulfur carrier subunit